MSLEVYLREGETQESLLKRFQRTIQMSGILREVKASRHFVSKGEMTRVKAKKNAQRRRRLGYNHKMEQNLG
jgi:ribosomal protein S21